MIKFYINIIVSVLAVLIVTGCSKAEFHYDGSKLLTSVGEKEGITIKSNGKAGVLVYGPYMPLEIGKYELVAKGNLTGPTNLLGTIDVISTQASMVLITKPIDAKQEKPGNIASLQFEITKPFNDAEFRIIVADKVTGSFSSYELTKL